MILAACGLSAGKPTALVSSKFIRSSSDASNLSISARSTSSKETNGSGPTGLKGSIEFNALIMLFNRAKGWGKCGFGFKKVDSLKASSINVKKRRNSSMCRGKDQF